MCRLIAIVSVQQSSGGVRRRVGHHVFAWVVERRQVPGVHLGVVRAGRFPTDAVQQFGLGVLLPVAPTAVDPQRLLAAGAQHAQLRQVATDHRHVEVAQLFAGVLFPLQVHDRNNDARQHDDQGRQQHDDPRLAVGRRRIRPGRVRRVHDDRHRGAVGPVPTPSVRLHPGREATAHR